MNIAFLGIGNVGAPLAGNLAKAGHEVTIAARDPDSESVQKALAAYPGLAVLPPKEAVAQADVVFLATPFAANEAALKGLEADLKGKVLVDCTNPVGAGITHGLDNKISGAESVQALAPGAHVVKAFSIYGYENFIDSRYPAAKEPPAMLIAGDNVAAKQTVSKLCADLGWNTLDVGPLSSSLHLEHMALLWIKMARLQGKGPDFVWAVLER